MQLRYPSFETLTVMRPLPAPEISPAARYFRFVVAIAAVVVLTLRPGGTPFHWQFALIVSAALFADTAVNRIRHSQRAVRWLTIAAVLIARDWFYGSERNEWINVADQTAVMALAGLAGQWIAEQIPWTRKRDIIESR